MNRCGAVCLRHRHIRQFLTTNSNKLHPGDNATLSVKQRQIQTETYGLKRLPTTRSHATNNSFSFAVLLQRQDHLPTRVVAFNAPWIALLKYVKALPFIPRRTVVFEDVPLFDLSAIRNKTYKTLIADPFSDTQKGLLNFNKQRGSNAVGMTSRCFSVLTSSSSMAAGYKNHSINALCSLSEYKDAIQWILAKQRQRERQEKVHKQLIKAVETHQMRHAVTERLRKAVLPCGEATKILLFTDHDGKSLNSLNSKVFQGKRRTGTTTGISFVEFTSSDITSRLLAPECQLFGVVWPSEPLGHLIYPQNPKTYRSVIIKQRSTQSAAFRTSKIKEATNQHNSDNARQELNKQTEILNNAVAVLYRAVRNPSRKNLQFSMLLHPVGVRIRRVGTKANREVFSIGKVPLRSTGYKRSAILFRKTAKRSLPQRKRVCQYRTGESFMSNRLVMSNKSAYTSSATLRTSACSSAGKQLISFSSSSAESPRSAKLCLKSRHFTALSPRCIPPALRVTDPRCHPTQLILRFHSFRIAYAVFMILKTSPMFKAFDLGLISDRKLISRVAFKDYDPQKASLRFVHENQKSIAVTPVTLVATRLVPCSDAPPPSSSWTSATLRSAPPEALKSLFEKDMDGLRCLLQNDVSLSDILFKLIDSQRYYSASELVRVFSFLERESCLFTAATFRQLYIVRQGIPSFSAETLGSLSGLCKRGGVRSPKMFVALWERSIQVLTEFSGPDFCSVLAYVSSAKDPAFVSSIVNVAKPLNKRFGDVGRECSITDLAAGLNAFARLKILTPKLLDTLSSSVTKKLLDKGGPKEWALIAHAYSQCDAPALRVCTALSNCILRQLTLEDKRLLPKDVAMLCHAFARLEYKHPDCFKALSLIIQKMLPLWILPRDLVSVSYAFGKLSITDVELLIAVANQSLNFLKRFRNCDLALLLYGFTRHNMRHRKVVEAIADEVLFRCTLGEKNKHEGRIRSLDLQSCCLLLRGFAVLGLHDVRLIVALTDSIKPFLESISKTKDAHLSLPSDVACNLMQSVSRTHLRLVPFLDAVSSVILKYEKRLTTEAAANVLRSCAHLNYSPPKLINFLMKELERLLPAMTPSCTCSTLRSMASLNIYRRHYVKTALQQISVHFNAVPSISIFVRIVESLRTLNFRDSRRMKTLIPIFSNNLEHLPLHELCLLLEAYVELRIESSDFCSLLCRRIFSLQHELDFQDAVLLVRALSRLERVAKLPADAGTRETCSLHVPWSVQLLSSALDVLYSEEKLPHSVVRDLCCLHLVLETDDPHALGSLPANLRKATYETVVSAHAAMRQEDFAADSANRQRSIFTAMVVGVRRSLHQLGISFEENVMVGPFCVPFVIGRSTLLELDGPDQFYRDTFMRTASSLQRHKVLCYISDAAPFHLKRIHSQDWASCVTWTEKYKLCVNTLRNHDPSYVATDTAETEDGVNAWSKTVLAHEA